MILNQYKPVLSMKHKEIFCFVIIIMYVPKNFVILLQENGLIFFKIIFTVGRYTWGEFASARSMLDRRHEGRGRATPIF